MIERTEYGYPIEIRQLQARQYAAQVRERNKLPCQCDTCKTIELLPAVQRLTERWQK